MRRYAVRFVVAVLTFGIGVTLSLALGLFKPRRTVTIIRPWSESTSCPKKFRSARPWLVNIDNDPNEPLGLQFRGPLEDSEARERRMHLLIVNRSEKTVSGYAITGKAVTNDSLRERELAWNSTVLLEPGESRLIAVPREVFNTQLLRVESVTFQDGSVWNNPREDR